MSRLTIDITDQQHQSLKVMAALQGKTIKQYALERLFPDPAEGDAGWDALRALLDERIAEGLSGHVSAMSAKDVVEEVLRQKRSA